MLLLYATLYTCHGTGGVVSQQTVQVWMADEDQMAKIREKPSRTG